LWKGVSWTAQHRNLDKPNFPWEAANQISTSECGSTLKKSVQAHSLQDLRGRECREQHSTGI
jgi:hypothetical protein